MDEMSMVRQLLAEPPPPTPVVTAARGRLESRIRHRVPLAHQGLLARRGRLVPRAALGIAVAAAAATLIVTALVPAGPPGGSAITGAGPAGTLTGIRAQKYLLAVAVRAGRPAARGKYWAEDWIYATRERVGPPSDPHSVIRSTREDDWTSPSRPGWNAGFYQQLGARPGPVTYFHFTRPGRPPWGSTSALPTSAARLKKFLMKLIPGFPGSPGGPGGPGGQHAQLYQQVIPLLEDPISPALRAAVYDVLAGIRGVRVTPGVRDPDGRLGTALTTTWGGQGTEVERDIIDPATGQLLAFEYLATKPSAGTRAGTLLAYNLVRSERWTNQPPPKG
jgi:hypothetical protein